jgi:hypothetical protein
VEEFGEKLELNASGLDVRHEINSNIVTHEELLEYFWKKIL